MATAITNTVDWKLIWAQRGFRYFFFAMFVSLFGSGMNFAGVSWYILAATHSTVKVSWQVIVMTIPGLFVPFLGGVLIDRFDRRYLGVMLDLVRGFFVLLTAYIAWRGHLQLWHLYAMTLITGTGSAMYWATVNALVQEVIPHSQFTGANAAVLVGVQSGDVAIAYASVWQCVFAVVEVVSAPAHEPARARWSWTFAIRPLVVVPDLHDAPAAEEVGIFPSSLWRHSYIRLAHEQFEAARELIGTIAAA